MKWTYIIIHVKCIKKVFHACVWAFTVLHHLRWWEHWAMQPFWFCPRHTISTTPRVWWVWCVWRYWAWWVLLGLLLLLLLLSLLNSLSKCQPISVWHHHFFQPLNSFRWLFVVLSNWHWHLNFVLSTFVYRVQWRQFDGHTQKPIVENCLYHLPVAHPAAVEVLMLNETKRKYSKIIIEIQSVTIDEYVQLWCCDEELDKLPCNVDDAMSSQDVESWLMSTSLCLNEPRLSFSISCIRLSVASCCSCKLTLGWYLYVVNKWYESL